MLFTAPAFVFLFLPLAVIFCALFGKRRKKLCLAIVCAVYYFMLYISEPLNMLWLPLLILYSYLAGRAVRALPRRLLAAVLCALPVLWLLVMRNLAYLELDGFSYPVGMTLPALSAAAYVWTSLDDGEETVGLPSLALYLSFFPIMLIGPFLTCGEFCRVVEAKREELTFSELSEGIGIFALGFIKRIAVGAVLVEGYGLIFARSWESPSVAIVPILLLLIYFGTFFSVVGYYDMGVGIARMLGVRVPVRRVNPFTLVTVNEYSQEVFGGVRKWSELCITRPIASAFGKSPSRTLGIFVYCVCTVIFISAKPRILSLAVPLIAFSCASASLGLEKSRRGGRTGLRALFGVLTVLVVGAFWVFITMSGGDSSVLEYIDEITMNNAEYQTDMLLIAVSGKKYLFVALLGIATVIPWTGFAKKRYAALSDRACAVLDYGSMALLLVAFSLTVVFFLPQLEQYAYKPFTYIVI